MQDVNRCLMIVKPRQQLLDWIHSRGMERYTLEQIREESSAYLIPEYEEEGQKRLLLELVYATVFEAELFSWYTDESMWPEQRDLKMFLEWFEVDFHSLVFDLDDSPLEHIDYDSPLDPNSNGH